MLFEIMRHIHNFFGVEYETGSFKIEDGVVSLPFVTDGQYILIEGSLFNDGVYKYPVTNLIDEAFDGAITSLAPPKAFLDLADKIESWESENSTSKAGPYQSESFGGYSYSKATNSRGGTFTWMDNFKSELDMWRKR